MAEVTIRGSTNINSLGSSRILSWQNYSWPRPQPVPAYYGQDISWAATSLIGGSQIPATTLELITIENASFVIQGGFDGLILTRDLKCVEETTLFSSVWRSHQADRAPQEFTIPAELANRKFGDVFLGFDAAWVNYFHWICFALAKSCIAARALSESCTIVVPDYSAHANNKTSIKAKPLAFSEDVWRQSLGLAGLSNRVLPLSSGIYEAERIHLIRARPAIANADLFLRIFSEIRFKLRNRAGTRSRVFVSRKHARDPRIDATDHHALEEALDRRGFASVLLEKLSFVEQAELFYNADIVVAPHGSGLTNVLFGSEQLKVLELNRRIGAEVSLRPWFYELSAHRDLRYSYLDLASDSFSTNRVIGAIDNLLDG